MRLLFQNLLALMIIITGFTVGCKGALQKPTPPPVEEESMLKTESITLASSKSQIARQYYLDGLDIKLRVPQYNLPLNLSLIDNMSSFNEKVTLSARANELIEANGFAVIRNPFFSDEEDISKPYISLKNKEIPIFITTDSLLHLYHIQFDETLRKIEEREFYDKIWTISKNILEYASAEYSKPTDPSYKDALNTVMAYFSVGLELLKPKPDQICKPAPTLEICDDAVFSEEEQAKYVFQSPPSVESVVTQELGLVDSHQGFNLSPIFKYQDDYSQYLPRGHYTRSEKLKNYFKAMMWFGRMSFVLKGCLSDCLVSEDKARELTRAALVISKMLSENEALLNKWDRIYVVTSFYVGISDDLGPYEYIEAMNEVFGNSFEPSELNEENLNKIKTKLAAASAPKIYGGTGACEIPPPYTPEQADECLDKTKGFRLMGQRFVPDSYMFSNLVGAYTGTFTGSGTPFTLAGSIRGFPRGLDIMSILGSKRAGALLAEYNDSSYERYAAALGKMEEEFGSLSYEDWNKNLYWSWLFALKPFLKEFGTGYPTFMRTSAWQDKTLTTALASWAELRHDTILYAKQSYTPTTTAGPGGGPTPEPKPVVGYVEPVPEFYNRLLALTVMTTKGLSELGVIDEHSKSQFDNLAIILERLKKISIAELENKELVQGDYDFIKDFGTKLNAVIGEVEDEAKKTTIVADVHTDANTGQVLEEGIGYVDLVVVAYLVPDGRILIGAGPVMTYYEFKERMSDRLTDEKWREKLKSNPPARPEWVANFAE